MAIGRGVAVAVVAIVSAAALVACGARHDRRMPAPGPSARPTDTAAAAASGACAVDQKPAVASGSYDMWYGGLRRSYLLAVPAAYDPARAYPLMVNFHGYASSKEEQESQTHLGRDGSARGYIVVTPSAVGFPPQWNAFSAAGMADDYGFVDTLVSRLRANLCVDSRRVFAVGHSNGSAFAGFLVCRRPYEFSAVGMVSATVPITCPTGVSPSVISIHGTNDSQVPYDGGIVTGSSTYIPPVVNTIASIAQRYQCRLTPTRADPAPGVDQLRYQSSCERGTEVVLDTVVGGTHPWPGSTQARADWTASRAAKTFSATKAILDFFDGLHDHA